MSCLRNKKTKKFLWWEWEVFGGHRYEIEWISAYGMEITKVALRCDFCEMDHEFFIWSNDKLMEYLYRNFGLDKFPDFGPSRLLLGSELQKLGENKA